MNGRASASADRDDIATLDRRRLKTSGLRQLQPGQATLLSLQRQAGNQAVCRLLQTQRQEPAAHQTTRSDEDDLPPDHPASKGEVDGSGPQVSPGSPDSGSAQLASGPSAIPEGADAEKEEPEVQTLKNPFSKIATTFPSFLRILASPTVEAQAHAAWLTTLATCTPTARREQGFWVQWNTRLGTFSTTGHSTGPVVGPANGATINLPAKPADAPPIYTVASFHTHTPTTYRAVGRAVGPSGADVNADNADNVAGIVYDFWGNGSGNLPAGRSRFWPARFYMSRNKRV